MAERSANKGGGKSAAALKMPKLSNEDSSLLAAQGNLTLAHSMPTCSGIVVEEMPVEPISILGRNTARHRSHS